MSSSNPLSSDDAAIPEDQWLDAGLKALDEGDYLTALSYLAAVQQAQPNEPIGIQAQMGLVVTYERFGQPEQAIALCQELQHTPDQRVQAWAEETLMGLAQRHPRLLPNPPSAPVTPTSQPTGFVPLDGSAPAPALPKKSPVPPAPNLPPVPPISGKSATLPPVQLPDLETPDPTQAAPPARPSGRPQRSPTPSETTLIQGPQTQISQLQSHPHTWKQAGRAQRWQPLARVNSVPFWLLQLGTAIALFLVVRTVVWAGLASLDQGLLRLSFLGLQPLGAAYSDHSLVICLAGLALLGLSPWLLSTILRLQYGLRPLPMAKLAARSSEASRLINRLCRQRKVALPTLAVLPTPIPVVLTYGWLPRYSHIVVSQGLLERLSEDELAALYAAELGHIFQRDLILMSLLVTVLQLPYLLYWHSAIWGDTCLQKRQAARGKQPLVFWLATLGLGLTALTSALSYGLYRLLRYPTLWFSQLRLYYSDRLAAEATGNPNGLTRALLKMAMGIAQEVQKQGQTSPLLESFDLLIPVGHRQALSLGSSCAYRSFESLLTWDRANPFRYWLAINNSHPLLGDRLDKLARYARHWRLDSELDWDVTADSQRQPIRFDLRFWLPLLLQGAPFFGLLFGLGLGLLLWLLGGLAIVTDLWVIGWMFGDRWLLVSCVPIGFSIGTFLRINPFFPEIKFFSSQGNTPAANYLSYLQAATALPIDRQPVALKGKLLGRRGVSNWLGQDLILQTEAGLVALHHTHQVGPLGTLLSPLTRPADLILHSVTAVGWLRRGATPWVDLELLRSQRGKNSYSGHPLWSTILACATALLGALWILQFAGLPPS